MDPPVKTVRRAVAAAFAAGLVTAACGGSGGGAGAGGGSSAAGAAGGSFAGQTVEMSMVDLAFEPPAVAVKAGTAVRFDFRNEGSVAHEALFGDEPTQQAYEKGKAKRVGVEVVPGRTKTFVHTFDRPGPLVIGCHVSGHYQAGMKARLTVE